LEVTKLIFLVERITVQLTPQTVEMMHEAGLQRLIPFLEPVIEPAIGYRLCEMMEPLPHAASKLGGLPDLPETFDWPSYNGRKLDFLLQINLNDIRAESMQVAVSAGEYVADSLPRSGLLSFFYDTDDQPWNFDPATLDSFKVVFSSDITDLTPQAIPNPEFALPEHRMSFYSMVTLPSVGSKIFEAFRSKSAMTEQEWDAYFEWHGRLTLSEAGETDMNLPWHQMFGFPCSNQGDMQLEAQLVTNGIYCGDQKGYNDPRRAELEAAANDWLLLLQLDSDRCFDVCWGDNGQLYFWIRRQDLAQFAFDRVWMTLECH